MPWWSLVVARVVDRVITAVRTRRVLAMHPGLRRVAVAALFADRWRGFVGPDHASPGLVGRPVAGKRISCDQQYCGQ